MHKNHIVCDICNEDTTAHGKPAAMEVRAAYTEVHVCAACWKRPIGDLVEVVRGLEHAHEKAMREGQVAEAPMALARYR
jgi:hypothetical protein